MTEKTLLLALDLGATGSRALLVDDVRGEAGRCSGSGIRLGQELPEAVAGAVAHAIGLLSPSGCELKTLSIGLAGVNGKRPDAAALHRTLKRVVQVERLVAADDSVTAYLGAIGDGPGVAVAAGTGVTALAVGDDGTTVQSGGLGPFLGDWGGGYWIGRHGLEAAMRSFDRQEDGSATLLELAEHRFGSPSELPGRLWEDNDRVATIASFARDVAEASDRGDPVASQLLTEAGLHLAHTAAAAARDCSTSTESVGSWTGSVFQSRRLKDVYASELAALLPGLRLAPPRGDPLDGAIRLAALPLPHWTQPHVSVVHDPNWADTQ
jgi:N-acetylglucosamine kinase-like BadF-type ATPase